MIARIRVLIRAYDLEFGRGLAERELFSSFALAIALILIGGLLP